MKCAEAKLMFSPYLDGAVTGTQMHNLSRHLQGCSDCNREYALLRRTQELLATVKRQKAPADMQLKLQLAISREVANARHSRVQGFLFRMDNAMRAFMVPATAGLMAAIVIFAFVIGVTMPELQARNTNDVPLMLYTGPELQESSFATTVSGVNDDSGLSDPFRFGEFAETVAASEADADFHDLPAGDVDGTSHGKPRRSVVRKN